MSTKPSRRIFHFSLRSLLVVTTVLCCFLAWQTHIVRQRRAARESVNGKYSYTFTSAALYSQLYPVQPPKRPATIPLIRSWLGDEAVQQVVYLRFNDFTEADLANLQAHFPETEFIESLPEPCHPGCFPAGTLVETSGGPLPIQSIKVGDHVLIVAADGKLSSAPVQSIFTTPNLLWEVVTADGILTTTETQPLCTSLDRTIQAGDLQPGDTLLRCQAGAIRPVQVLEVNRTGRSATVFNLVIGNLEHFIAGGFVARSKPPEPASPPQAPAATCPPL